MSEQQIEIDESALNDAGWELDRAYCDVMGEPTTAKFFNNLKAVLRPAIVEYLKKTEGANNGIR